MNNDPLTIIKGEDKVVKVILTDEDERPIDLTNITEIKAIFKGVTKTLTSTDIVKTNNTLGELSISLSQVDTNLLESEEKGDFELELIDNTTKKTIVQFKNVIRVRNRLQQ